MPLANLFDGRGGAVPAASSILTLRVRGFDVKYSWPADNAGSSGGNSDEERSEPAEAREFLDRALDELLQNSALGLGEVHYDPETSGLSEERASDILHNIRRASINGLWLHSVAFSCLKPLNDAAPREVEAGMCEVEGNVVYVNWGEERGVTVARKPNRNMLKANPGVIRFRVPAAGREHELVFTMGKTKKDSAFGPKQNTLRMCVVSVSPPPPKPLYQLDFVSKDAIKSFFEWPAPTDDAASVAPSDPTRDVDEPTGSPLNATISFHKDPNNGWYYSNVARKYKDKKGNEQEKTAFLGMCHVEFLGYAGTAVILAATCNDPLLFKEKALEQNGPTHKNYLDPDYSVEKEVIITLPSHVKDHYDILLYVIQNGGTGFRAQTTMHVGDKEELKFGGGIPQLQLNSKVANNTELYYMLLYAANDAGKKTLSFRTITHFGWQKEGRKCMWVYVNAVVDAEVGEVYNLSDLNYMVERSSLNLPDDEAYPSLKYIVPSNALRAKLFGKLWEEIWKFWDKNATNVYCMFAWSVATLHGKRILELGGAGGFKGAVGIPVLFALSDEIGTGKSMAQNLCAKINGFAVCAGSKASAPGILEEVQKHSGGAKWFEDLRWKKEELEKIETGILSWYEPKPRAIATMYDAQRGPVKRATAEAPKSAVAVTSNKTNPIKHMEQAARTRIVIIPFKSTPDRSNLPSKPHTDLSDVLLPNPDFFSLGLCDDPDRPEFKQLDGYAIQACKNWLVNVFENAGCTKTSMEHANRLFSNWALVVYFSLLLVAMLPRGVESHIDETLLQIVGACAMQLMDCGETPAESILKSLANQISLANPVTVQNAASCLSFHNMLECAFLNPIGNAFEPGNTKQPWVVFHYHRIAQLLMKVDVGLAERLNLKAVDAARQLENYFASQASGDEKFNKKVIINTSAKFYDTYKCKFPPEWRPHACGDANGPSSAVLEADLTPEELKQYKAFAVDRGYLECYGIPTTSLVEKAKEVALDTTFDFEYPDGVRVCKCYGQTMKLYMEDESSPLWRGVEGVPSYTAARNIGLGRGDTVEHLCKLAKVYGNGVHPMTKAEVYMARYGDNLGAGYKYQGEDSTSEVDEQEALSQGAASLSVRDPQSDEESSPVRLTLRIYTKRVHSYLADACLMCVRSGSGGRPGVTPSSTRSSRHTAIITPTGGGRRATPRLARSSRHSAITCPTRRRSASRTTCGGRVWCPSLARRGQTVSQL